MGRAYSIGDCTVSLGSGLKCLFGCIDFKIEGWANKFPTFRGASFSVSDLIEALRHFWRPRGLTESMSPSSISLCSPSWSPYLLPITFSH